MTQERCRIIFMGSPDFACPTLRRLAAEHDVVHILTQPPRAKGRGMTEQKQLSPPVVIRLASQQAGQQA